VRIFADTSALFALLDEDDDGHARAAAFVRGSLGTDALVTTNYVVIESVALVRRRLGVESVRRLIDRVLPAIDISWVEPDLHARALAAYRSAPGTSLVDRVSFEVMRRDAIGTAFAFDDDFAREGFRMVP
jgi:uncharacterized protein